MNSEDQILPNPSEFVNFQSEIILSFNNEDNQINNFFSILHKHFNPNHYFLYRLHKNHQSVAILSSDIVDFDPKFINFESNISKFSDQIIIYEQELKNFGNLNEKFFNISIIISQNPENITILTFLFNKLIKIFEPSINIIKQVLNTILIRDTYDINFLVKRTSIFDQIKYSTLSSHHFSVDSYDEDNLFEYLLLIFVYSNVLDRIKINIHSLIKFLIKLSKIYLSPPYHNWYHAIDATQYIFTFILTRHLYDYLNNINIFSLIFATICHDTEHDGKTNLFHKNSNSLYSQLSGPNLPPLEFHHINRSLILLFSEFHSVIESFNELEKKEFIKFVIEIILATDMSKHQFFIDQFKTITNSYNKENLEHRLILCQIAMKSADLSNTVRSFPDASLMAQKLRDEWFLQGDEEKKLNLPITKGFDRYNSDSLPKTQIGFYKFVALPLVEQTNCEFLKCNRCCSDININLKKWESLIENE